MSPPDPALAVLAAGLRADAEDLGVLSDRIAMYLAKQAADPVETAYGVAVAFSVDRYYTAVEACLCRVAAALDGGVPQGPDWHHQLLRQAMADLPGIRPAVISAAAKKTLSELLSFRHKVRHTYLLDLDAGRLSDLGRAAQLLHPPLVAELLAFAESLSPIRGERT